VGVGIEMDCVGQILTINTVPGRLIHFLRPLTCAQDDDVLGVLPNHRNHLFMVWLDATRPTLVHRLIEELEEHIGVATVLASHL
jgi:hypothetical protein